MNPPGDTDTDGSPSNCNAFFISTVHDLSLYETRAPRSPPHSRDSLFPSLMVSCSAFISPCPTDTFSPFLFPLLLHLVQCPPPQSLFFVSILVSDPVCVSLLLWSLPPDLLSLVGSLFNADVPLVSGGLAGRQQKWLWGWGMAVLLSMTHRATLVSLWLHT